MSERSGRALEYKLVAIGGNSLLSALMKNTTFACLVAALALSAGTSLAATPIYQLKVPATVKVAASPGTDTTTPTQPPVVVKTIVATEVGRNWSDGTFAKSCKEYLQGDGSHQYAGAVGSGVYTIAPMGTPVNAYCDMQTDGGGWTLAAYNRGVSGPTLMPRDFFATSSNIANLGNRTTQNTAASLNVEAVSIALKSNDVMLFAPAYSATPIIEKNQGPWNYDTPDCTGPLGHTGRTSGCSNHVANDTYQDLDRFNIAIYGMGNTAIVPWNYQAGGELCWQNRGWCNFEFYVR